MQARQGKKASDRIKSQLGLVMALTLGTFRNGCVDRPLAPLDRRPAMIEAVALQASAARRDLGVGVELREIWARPVRDLAGDRRARQVEIKAHKVETILELPEEDGQPGVAAFAKLDL